MPLDMESDQVSSDTGSHFSMVSITAQLFLERLGTMDRKRSNLSPLPDGYHAK